MESVEERTDKGEQGRRCGICGGLHGFWSVWNDERFVESSA